jgi:lysozyme family protein
MADFEKAVAKLLHLEGGFSARDNGAGAVNFGITQRFLQSINVQATVEYVRQLTRLDAAALYREHFWQPLRLDEFQCQEIADTLFNAAVNMGPDRAVRCLQEAAGVAADGKIGPVTITAVNKTPCCCLLEFRKALKARYRSIAEHNPGECGDDLDGWLRRVDA